MSARIGLDKLCFLLRSSDVTFSPDFPATVEHPVNAATGESTELRTLYMAGGREVCGKKAHFNTPNYQLGINHDRARVTGAKDEARVTVQFSAGAFSDSNLEPLDRDRCADVALAVQQHLAEQGAKLDLEHAALFRLDIARNVRLEHPVACYGPALAAVGARKRVRRMDFGGTGFIVGNKRWEIGFYDKGEQMHELGYDRSKCPENTLRPELRLMKSVLIRQHLGCDSLRGLRDAWPKLKPTYDAFLERDVFRSKSEKNREASVDWELLAQVVNDSDARREWQHFKSLALPVLMVQDMGVEMAKEFAASRFCGDRSSDAGRRQSSRINVELEQAAFALKMHEQTRDGHRISHLYDELKQRVLAD